MSDKMLMENWRKFLAESPEDDYFRLQQIRAKKAAEDAAAAAAEEEKAGCYTLSDLLNYIEEFKAADKKTKKQLEDWRQKEMAADLGKSLVAGALMTVATGGLTIPVAIGAGAGATLVGWITNKSGEYSVNPPSESELANSRFLDKLDLHPVFDASLSRGAIRHAREAWQELVAKKLEGFEQEFGNVCYEDLDNLVADAIPDINVFMQTYHNLCRSEHEYKGQGGDLSQGRYAGVEPVAGDIYESWRKFLKEEKLLKESIGDFYDTLDEDSLYDLDLEDLLGLRDFIEDFGGPGPRTDPKDLYPTIIARIEAIGGSQRPEVEPIEGLYSGEYAIKLAKTFINSSRQAIDLAIMISGAESLAEEFRRIQDGVQELLRYAEDGDDAPWMDRSANDPEGTEPDAIKLILSMEALIKQLTHYPGEITRDNKDEALEEEQEVWNMYASWQGLMEDLEQYAYYQLHGSPSIPKSGSYRRYFNSYDRIKDWAGEN
jgi:hypothetical protein